MVVIYSLLSSFTITMDIIWNQVEFFGFIPIGFETGMLLSRVYIRDLSWDSQFFDLKNKVIFIVAGSCANNAQSLKEIRALADLELLILLHCKRWKQHLLSVFKRETNWKDLLFFSKGSLH